MAVWKNPDGYDGDRGSVRSWLMGTVHHRAVDLVRREEAYRRRAEDAIPEAYEEQADHADEVVQAIGLPEERRIVRAALAELPEEQRRGPRDDVLRRAVADADRRGHRPPARHGEVPRPARHASHARRPRRDRAMNHDRIEERLAVRALGGLDEADAAALEAEMATHGDCAECRRLERELTETAGRLAFALDPAPVDPGTADRILAARPSPPIAPAAVEPPARHRARPGRRTASIPRHVHVVGVAAADRARGRRRGRPPCGRGTHDGRRRAAGPDDRAVPGRSRDTRDGLHAGPARGRVLGLGSPGSRRRPACTRSG